MSLTIFSYKILTVTINNEYTKKEKKKYPGLTRFVDGIQIAGSKVFEFKWILIKK